MPWNGSGTFSLDPSYSPEVAGTTIQPGRYNGLTGDIATGISNALAKDGQNTPTANLPMGSKKLTGLAAGSANGDSVRYEQANVIGETSVTANATTSDIFAAPTARVLLNGTGVTVTAFPSSSLDTWKLVRFNGINVLTNSAGLVCKGGANITTASGDMALIYSSGSSAYIADYFYAAGDTFLLSRIIAAASANSFNNADFAQTWNWKVTTASKVAFTISENVASTGASATLFAVANLSGSTARPFVAQWTGTANGQIGYSTTGDAQLAAPTLSTNATGATATIAAGGAGTTTGTGGAVNITAGSGGSSSGSGGAIVLTGGAAPGGVGGKIQLKPGVAATTAGVEIWSFLEATPTWTFSIAATTGHMLLKNPSVSGKRPSISSGGGTGPTITGSDNAFRLTIGTTPGSTAIVLNFNQAYSDPPVVVTSLESTGSVRINPISSTSQLTLTPSTSWTAGDIINVICIGIGTS